MAGKEPDLGGTAITVAENVKLLRESQNMNYTQLSDRLKAVADWSINAVGIRRIEAGERRVNPDDLVALALALGVSPITLLMPVSDSPESPVSVTGVEAELSADQLLDWLLAENPLPGDNRMPTVFRAAALPEWKFVEQVTEKRKHDAAWLKARRAQLREQKRMETDGDD